jgi:histidine triad (HIT) family protein
MGEVTSDQVLSDESCVAFRDINPQAPTHVLIVPRKHIENAGTIQTGDAQILESMFLMAQEVAAIQGIDKSGYRLIFNTGEDALNSVAHLHMHLLGGRAMGWPPG